jgi:1-acyl-sn-glycerol-3-phosphate acyltransferase
VAIIVRLAPTRTAAPGEPDLGGLVRANVDDLLAAFGLERVRWGRPLLAALCRPAARRFAQQAAQYDRVVAAAGLQAGGLWGARRLTTRLEVAGQDRLPVEGPLLVVANHPGVGDTLALFASLPRPDLRIVAAARPFLEALPATRQRLIELPDGPHGRRAVIHQVVEHLRGGGAILAFPGGRIEPDPALAPGAAAALLDWSTSVGVFARRVARIVVVPAIVSGVLSPRLQRHPLTWLRRRPADRERLGAMLQIVSSWRADVAIRVAFGPPLEADRQLEPAARAAAMYRAVTADARAMIERPPLEWQQLL